MVMLQMLPARREQMLFTPQVFSVAPSGGAGLLGLLGRQGSGGFLPLWGGPPARFGDFPAVESHAGVRGRSASQLYHIACQTARLVRKNPQFQPHILFSSRRKENVPLTVQEKRAAGGAVPLWRTPPDPLRSAPRTDAFSPHKSLPRHPPADNVWPRAPGENTRLVSRGFLCYHSAEL